MPDPHEIKHGLRILSESGSRDFHIALADLIRTVGDVHGEKASFVFGFHFRPYLSLVYLPPAPDDFFFVEIMPLHIFILRERVPERHSPAG
jgi:hypothetical protein